MSEQKNPKNVKTKNNTISLQWGCYSLLVSTLQTLEHVTFGSMFRMKKMVCAV